MQGGRLNLPNLLTILRIAATAGLLSLSPGTGAFAALYVFGGVTDALDGRIARATGTASGFGAMLDSVADLLFYAAMLVKLLPVLWELLPAELWWGVGIVVLLRLACYATFAVRRRRFAALHTPLNKLTGLLVFLLPFTLGAAWMTAYCALATAVAGIAALDELCWHLRGAT